MARSKGRNVGGWAVGIVVLSVLVAVSRGAQRGQVRGDHDEQGGDPTPTKVVILVTPEDQPSPTPTPTGVTNLITPPAAPTATPVPGSEPEQTSETETGGLIQNVINSFSGQSPTPTQRPSSSGAVGTTTQSRTRTTTKVQAVEEPSFKAELVKTQLDLTTEKIGDLKKVGLKVPGLVMAVDQVITEHNDFSQKVDAEILRIESRTKLVKWVLGPNFTALKALNQLIAVNAGEIKTLQDLLFKVSDPNDIASIKAAVEAIKQENEAIQDQIDAESARPSIFGFAMKFLSK